jgi:hypothetical protein
LAALEPSVLCAAADGEWIRLVVVINRHVIFSFYSQKYPIIGFKKNSGACAFILRFLVADIGKFNFKIVKTDPKESVGFRRAMTSVYLIADIKEKPETKNPTGF